MGFTEYPTPGCVREGTVCVSWTSPINNVKNVRNHGGLYPRERAPPAHSWHSRDDDARHDSRTNINNRMAGIYTTLRASPATHGNTVGESLVTPDHRLFSPRESRASTHTPHTNLNTFRTLR